MESYIACAPEDHPVILGAGGFREVRWAKSRTETLSAADRNVLARIAAQIKRAAKEGGKK
jgi:hypothetical protein